MINLIPEESKKEIRAARANVTLLNYIVILCFGVVFLALISVGVYFVLATSQADAKNLIAVSNAKSSTYASAEAQGTALRSGLSSAKTILSQEVLYTKILTGIATLMPKGVVLNGINLSPSTLGAPTTLQFYAKTTQDAIALKNGFESSSLFSKVSFVSLASATTGQSSDYPVNATLSLIINIGSAK
jgi:hypothetical protein